MVNKSLQHATLWFCFFFFGLVYSLSLHENRFESIEQNFNRQKCDAIYLARFSSTSRSMMGLGVAVTWIGIIARALTFASVLRFGARWPTASGCRITFMVFLRKVCGFFLFVCVSTIRILNKIIILHTYIHRLVTNLSGLHGRKYKHSEYICRNGSRTANRAAGTEKAASIREVTWMVRRLGRIVDDTMTKKIARESARGQ